MMRRSSFFCATCNGHRTGLVFCDACNRAFDRASTTLEKTHATLIDWVSRRLRVSLARCSCGAATSVVSGLIEVHDDDCGSIRGNR